MKTFHILVFVILSITTITANDIFITTSARFTEDIMSWKDGEWKDVNIRIEWDTKTSKVTFEKPFDFLNCIVTKQNDLKNPTDEIEHSIICTAVSSKREKSMLTFNFHPEQEICYLTVIFFENFDEKPSSAIKFAIKYEDIFSTD